MSRARRVRRALWRAGAGLWAMLIVGRLAAAAAEAPPDGVYTYALKPSDVSAAFAAPTPLRIWYDPQTLVLDAVEVPAEGLQIRLISRRSSQ